MMCVRCSGISTTSVDLFIHHDRANLQVRVRFVQEGVS